MARNYYLVKDLETGKEFVKLRQDFNKNYKWHRTDEIISIKTMLQGFRNKTCKVIKVY